MSYVNIGDANKNNLALIKLINKAGRVVEPSKETVLSTMNDFRDEIHQGATPDLILRVIIN